MLQRPILIAFCIFITHTLALAKVDLIPYQRALNTNTLQARMIQKNDDGTINCGYIYIKRPGKVRITYDPPPALDIVSDGKKIIQYDGQKNKSHSTNIKNTPFSFLLDYFSFCNNKEISVKSVTQGQKTSTIIVNNKKRPHSGCVHIHFIERPKNAGGAQLSGWTLVGPQGQKTSIVLKNIVINAPIPDHYFKIVRA